MHDPTSEYLDPPLQGYRLNGEQYEAIAPDPRGGLYSEELDLRLVVEDGELNLFFPDSNERLLTNHALAVREAEARRMEAEARQMAEAEVERLRAELAKYQRGSSA